MGSAMLLCSRRWFAVVSLILLGTVSAQAEDRDLAFIHGLVARGFPDVAVEYLETMKTKPELSPAAKDLWDLEMSKCLRAQAQQIADPVEREGLNNKAQQYLEKFAKDKPNHPEALQAELTTAAAIMDQGNELLALSRTAADPKESAAKMAAARKAFEQSKPLLERGLVKLKERVAKFLKEMPPGPNTTKKKKDWIAERDRLELDLTQAEGRLALIDYYRAKRWPARKKTRNVAKRSANRSIGSTTFIAQSGQGPEFARGAIRTVGAFLVRRTAEELGDAPKAHDIYDEVLENFQVIDKTNPKYQKTDVDDVLARTKHFALLMMLKDPKEAKDYDAAAASFCKTSNTKRTCCKSGASKRRRSSSRSI